MPVSNLVFDALLFGLLLICSVLDSSVPFLQGTASLLVVGAFTYWAAQELSEKLVRRAGWSQESLATSVALSTGGFVYFWWRNQSDLSLLVLSIGLMMSSLMVAISLLGAGSAAFKEGNGTSAFGWVTTFGCSMVLGILAGALALTLGYAGVGNMLALKAFAILVSLAVWKVREKSRPPEANPHFHTLEAQKNAGLPPAVAQTRWALFPHRGTTIDRLLPLLILGVVLLVGGRQFAFPNAAVPPAAAQPATAPSPG